MRRLTALFMAPTVLVTGFNFPALAQTSTHDAMVAKLAKARAEAKAATTPLVKVNPDSTKNSATTATKTSPSTDKAAKAKIKSKLIKFSGTYRLGMTIKKGDPKAQGYRSNVIPKVEIGRFVAEQELITNGLNNLTVGDGFYGYFLGKGWSVGYRHFPELALGGNLFGDNGTLVRSEFGTDPRTFFTSGPTQWTPAVTYLTKYTRAVVDLSGDFQRALYEAQTGNAEVYLGVGLTKGNLDMLRVGFGYKDGRTRFFLIFQDNPSNGQLNTGAQLVYNVGAYTFTAFGAVRTQAGKSEQNGFSLQVAKDVAKNVTVYGAYGNLTAGITPYAGTTPGGHFFSAAVRLVGDFGPGRGKPKAEAEKDEQARKDRQAEAKRKKEQKKKLDEETAKKKREIDASKGP